MVDKIGEEYDGMISSVTNFGLFVELPNTIEGLVHVSYLTDDYYRYDEQHFAMIGERTGNVFRIGDEITIRVINVNKDERAIDFEIVGMKGTPRRKFKDRPVVIEQPRTGRKKRGGRSERSNGAAVNVAQVENLTVVVKEKEEDLHLHPLLLASQEKKMVTVRRKAFFENVPGFKKKRKSVRKEWLRFDEKRGRFLFLRGLRASHFRFLESSYSG